MKQKNQQEMKAAERQVALLVSALDKAKENGGVWLNKDGHPRPKMYPKGVNVSPFNALVMALHTDASNYSTPIYVTFNAAKDKNMAVMKGEQGVPFLWYNWDTFVNKENPEDKISRTTYEALPESVKVGYKAMQKREVNTIFNLDQTTFSSVDRDGYELLQRNYGSTTQRDVDSKELKSQVAHFLLTMRENLVPVKHKNQLARTTYDEAKDTVYISSQKNYPRYADFAQDTIRQIMLATGHNERLARVSSPSEDARKQEALITELTTGIKMAELGLPAVLSKEHLPYIDYWKQELQENPCLIDILEKDVNTTLELVSKAERGEKVEYRSVVRKAETETLKTPEVNSEEYAALLDIIRHEGKEVDKGNFSSVKKYHDFLVKFDLQSMETDKQKALADMKSPKATEEGYAKAEAEYNRISENILNACRTMLPATWNDKTNHFYVIRGLSQYVNPSNKIFLVVQDKRSRITDVVMNTGANLSPNKTPGSELSRIESILRRKSGASYVRFFNMNGSMGYHPDDTYFRGKIMEFCELHGWRMGLVATMEPHEAVLKAETAVFDKTAILRDDKGKWAIYMKPAGEPGFAVHPLSNDLNQFFSSLKRSDPEKVETIKSDLAQRYYAFAKTYPDQKFDIFGMDATQEDLDRINKASIFKTKEGKLFLLPDIEGAEKQKPREITKDQWQRAWLADDMASYKKQLSVKLFSDVLHPVVHLEEGEQISHDVNAKEEKQEYKEQAAELDAVAEPQEEVRVDLTGFRSLKEKHPDAVLLFREKDNYNAYQQDAVICSNVLGLEKTTRPVAGSEEKVKVASFPAYDLDTYLPKLIRAGNRIAICDALEAPKQEARQAQKQEKSQETENTHSHGLRR